MEMAVMEMAVILNGINEEKSYDKMKSITCRRFL